MSSITEAVRLLTLLTCYKISPSLGMEQISFSEIPDLRGKICLEPNTVVSRITGSAIKCVQLCVSLHDEECKVASFELSSSTCYGCGTTDLDQMTDATSVSFMRDAPTYYGNLVTAADGIPDERLSASSEVSQIVKHSPDRARLGTPRTSFGIGGWQPDSTDTAPYIQADFDRTRYIVGIVTQGRHDDGYLQYVTSYKSSVSLDCLHFNMIQDPSSVDVVFPGNSDSDTLVTNMLESPVLARCIRIHPIAFYSYICLRFDILGI